MKNMIKAELYKFSYSKSLLIILIVGIASILISAIPITEMLNESLAQDIYEVAPLPTGYESIAQGGLNGMLPFFIPFLVVLFFSSEFSRKTFYNLLGHNLSKGKIFVSKYCAFSIIVFALITILSIINLLIITLLKGWGLDFNIIQIVDIISIIIRMFLFHIASATIVIVLSIFLRSSALIVILFFAINIVDTFLASISYFIQQKVAFPEYFVKLLPTKYSLGFLQMSVSYDSLIFALISILISVSLCLGIGTHCLKKADIS